DVLVFLSGRDEVDTAVELINDHAEEKKKAQELFAVPLYSGMPVDEQLRVFRPTARGARKVVVATNIAEASVTIDGIVYVVDAGFVKMRAYNPKAALESLIKVPISKASALQRAGRAGRTRPGVAYRLYTGRDFVALRDNNVPEMQRHQLKAMGIDNVLRFDFLSPPSAESMAKALEILYSLKALDDYGRLTVPYGLQLAEFPLDPPMAAMLLNSGQFKCSEEALTIVAMLTVQNVFFQPSGARKAADEEKRKFSVEEGDHVTYLNVYSAFLKNKSGSWCHRHFLNYRGLERAVAVRSQLVKYLRRFDIPLVSARGDTVAIRKCILSGFFANAARLHHDGSYRTVRESQTVRIHPSSVLFNRSPQYVMFGE
ncbi:ATPdependent RNA helicase, partial [Cladochytrium tenue]